MYLYIANIWCHKALCKYTLKVDIVVTRRSIPRVIIPGTCPPRFMRVRLLTPNYPITGSTPVHTPHPLKAAYNPLPRSHACSSLYVHHSPAGTAASTVVVHDMGPREQAPVVRLKGLKMGVVGRRRWWVGGIDCLVI